VEFQDQQQSKLIADLSALGVKFALDDDALQ
jgi:hypothetical protein